jgi:protein-S-isoprenylcysteine O-methyltransferase Ste14
MIGFVISSPNIYNITLFLSLFGVLLLKAALEERLWTDKDDRYKEYKKETKMLIPFLI